MKFSISGITSKILSLAVMSVPLTLLILSACGGGGNATTPAPVSTAVGTQMGGARQGVSLNLASASATVGTLAGSAVAPAATLDGTGTAATFNWVGPTTTDGINLYVTECGSAIRKIVITTGAVTTLAGQAVTGSADGTGTAASFNCPFGITTDGNVLYVLDATNNKIRKIAPSSGTLSAMTSANAVVTTLAGSPTNALGSADGTGTAATFNNPSFITTDGTSLYVTDAGNNKIRKIAPSSGTLSAMTSANAVVTTLAGSPTNLAGSADGTGTAATFSSPQGITTDGSSLYVVDMTNNKIRKIAPSSGTLSAMSSANAVVTTLAGSPTNLPGSADGTGTAATFNLPAGITTDGTSLYVTDWMNNKIRKILPSSGALSAMTSANAVVSSLTGAPGAAVTAGTTDGAAATATFNGPDDIITDGISLYVADQNTNIIRKIH